MKKGIKKAIAYLMSAVLTVGLFSFAIPQTAIKAKAEEKAPVKKMQLGANILMPIMEEEKDTYDSDKKKRVTYAPPVLYGYDSNDFSSHDWLVIGNNGQGAVDIDGTLTLFAKNIIKDNQVFDSNSNSYSNSAIKGVVDSNYEVGSYSLFFSEEEKKVIEERTLKKGVYSDNSNNFNDGIKDDDKPSAYLWLLSTKEADLIGNQYRQAKDNWWLRSQGPLDSQASLVKNNGEISLGEEVTEAYGVRPALNLNLNSILFTSVADYKERMDEVGSNALELVDDVGENELYYWKLTIEDPNRTNSFKAERTDYNSLTAGNTVSIKFSGAQTGYKEFVSAIITDANDNILYYGKIAYPNSSAGEVSIKIKDGTPDDCKLYVFNEKYGILTDYSSKPLDLSAPKINSVANNINLVTNGKADYIEDSQKSNVYFGTYPQSLKDGTENEYNKDPIKWRVLSNVGGDLFLLSDKNLDVVQFNTTNDNVGWDKSTIRSWLNGYDGLANKQGVDYRSDNFIGTAFNNVEQSALLEVEVESDENLYDEKFWNNINDKIYLLSYEEAFNTFYGFKDSWSSTDTRKSENTAYVAAGGKIRSTLNENGFWLRSPVSNPKGGLEGLMWVGNEGEIWGGRGLPFDFIGFAVRPVTNIDLKSVILTSATEGGKSSDVLTGNSLQSIQTLDDTSNVVWTFTLRDTTRNNLSVSRLGSGDIANGGTVRFVYDNATVGDDDYISAILFDENDEMISYGKVVELSKDSDDSGESYVTLPSNLIDGKTYKLRFISEKCSANSPTDLASDFDSSRDISFTVGKGTPSAVDFDLQFSSGNSITAAADIMYNGSEWKVNANIPEGVTGMGEVTVKYIDSEGNESEDAPKDAGEYKIKLIISEGTNYSAIELTNDNWKYTINPADPKTSDFVFTAPADLNFDSKGKQATVTKKEEIDGITFKTEYYDSKGNKFDDGKYPVEPGKYFVKVIVSQEGNFNAGTLESTEWSFEIKTVDYTVTLNTDGGNIKSNNVTGYTYQTGATLPTASDIEKKGYTFKGWYENASFTGNPVTEITSIDYEDKTYYAKWEANKYTVIFDANAEGKEQCTMPNQDRTYDEKNGLTANAYKYEGRKFNCWTTNQDGSGTHYSDKEIANLTDIDGATVTLYAQWTIDTFTVVWKNYDGEELKTAQVPYGTTSNYNGDAPVKPDTAEFSYKFDKWSPEEGEITEATTYIATYTETRKSYTVKFVNEDGTELQSSELEYGSMPSYEKTPDKADNGNKTYHFAGWSPSIVSVTGEAIYQATYSEEEIVYTVTFDPNGGTVNPSEDITNEQFKLTMLPEPNLEGYKFLGWFTAVENGAEITTDTVFTADTTVYALWEEITEPEEPEEEEPEEPETPPDYLDELFLKLNIAAELGGKQEVYWNVGDSLPYDVLHFLELHEDITLIFDYTYEDVDYSVTLGGKGFEADPKVPWAGPLYLYSVYKGKIIAKED